MNRKYVLKNRKRFYIFVMLVTVILSSILFATNIQGTDLYENYATVTVKRGDTLWELAREYNHEGDIRRYINKVEEINNLSGSVIYEGDVLKMPA